MVVQLSPAAQAAQKAASREEQLKRQQEEAKKPENIKAPSLPTGPIRHHFISLQENLGIGDSGPRGGVQATVTKPEETIRREEVARATSTASAAMQRSANRAEYQKTQKEIKSRVISYEAEERALYKKYQDIEAAIKQTPGTVTTNETMKKLEEEKEVIGRQMMAARQHRDVLIGRQQELNEQISEYEKAATKQLTLVASKEQVETRQKYIQKQAESEARTQAAVQKSESAALASAYNWRKPPEYQIKPEYLQPGFLPESQRVELLQVVARDVPEAARFSKSLFTTYVDAESKMFSVPGEPGTPTDYFVGLTEGGPKHYFLELNETRQTLGAKDYAQLFNIGGGQLGYYEGLVNPSQFVSEADARRLRKEAQKKNKPILDELKNTLRGWQSAGIGTVIIRTEEGIMEVPTQRAYREALKSKNVLSITPIPNVPAGYTITGTIGTPVFFPEQATIRKQQIEAEAEKRKKQQQNDPTGLSLLLYSMEKGYPTIVGERGPIKETPLLTSLGRVATAGLVSAGGAYTQLANIVKTGQIETYQKLGQTKLALGAAIGAPELYVPKDAYAQPIGANVTLPTAEEPGAPKLIQTEKLPYIQRVVAAMQGQPLETNIGQTLFFAAPGAPLSKLAKVVPLRYVTTPFLTERGVEYLTKSVKFGYGDKLVPIIRKYGEGGFGIGKIKPELTGIQRIEGPTGKSSFETFELKDYSKAQIKELRPIIQYAEKEKIFPSGAFEAAVKEGKLKKGIESLKRPLKKEYQPDVQLKPIQGLSPGIKPLETIQQTAKVQKKKFLENVKGSSVFTQLKRFPFKVTIGDIDITAKTTEKGVRGAEEILKAGAKKGYALERRGANIIIGKAVPVKDIRIKPDFDEIMAISKGKKDSKIFKGVTITPKPKIREGVETKKIINIVTPREERRSALGSKIKTDRFYGEKYTEDSFSQNVKGIRQKLRSQGLIQQWEDLAGSQSGIVSRRTLEAAGNLEPGDIEKILGGSKVQITSLGHRLPKDPVRGYIALWKFAQVAKLTGKTKLAARIGEVMGEKVKLKPFVDWRQELRGMLTKEQAESLEIGMPRKKETIPVASTTITSSAPVALKPALSAKPSPSEKRESVYQKTPSLASRSVYSSISRKSAYNSMSSVRPSTSTRSLMSVSAKPSTSARSLSSSSASLTSAKSPASAMRSAGKSFFSSTDSVASPKSAFSPSPSSSSGKSPSPGPSPKSSLLVSPGPSVSMLSLKIPLPPIPTEVIPTRKPRKMFVPFLKQTTERQKPKDQDIYQFLGNVPVTEITGVYKRPDIIYGEKRTAKLVTKDLLGSARGRFTKTKKITLTTKPQPFFTESKKQQKKRERQLRTGTWII